MQNMIIPYKQEFESLNNSRYVTRSVYELSIWPDLIPVDKHTICSYEYWILNNLLDTIKIQDKSKYTNIIYLGTALTDNTPKTLAPLNSSDATKLIKRHIYAPDNKNNIELTRYACWTMMKKMENNTTFFQEYFMNPKASLLDVHKISTSSTRIPLRAHLSKLNTQINGILHSICANRPSHFAGLNREKYETFFGDKTKVSIIKTYHLMPNIQTPIPYTLAKPSNTHLIDYMQTPLLIAYGNALKAIINTWDSTSRTYDNFPTLREITYETMKRARNDFIKKYETTPENNLSPYGIKAVEHHRNMRELKFATQYINSHIR